MNTRLIEVVHDNCAGCRLCEMMCSLHHEQECSTTKSRIKIMKDEEFGDNVLLQCTQCAEAYCMESCPLDALSRDGQTGAVVVDSQLCNACGVCLVACPLGAIFEDEDKGTVFKCDLCGGDPECVKSCYRQALTLKEEDIASPTRKRRMEATIGLLEKMKVESQAGGGL